MARRFGTLVVTDPDDPSSRPYLDWEHGRLYGEGLPYVLDPPQPGQVMAVWQVPDNATHTQAQTLARMTTPAYLVVYTAIGVDLSVPFAEVPCRLQEAFYDD